jgi:hypothetical protein
MKRITDTEIKEAIEALAKNKVEPVDGHYVMYLTKAESRFCRMKYHKMQKEAQT